MGGHVTEVKMLVVQLFKCRKTGQVGGAPLHLPRLNAYPEVIAKRIINTLVIPQAFIYCFLLTL